jgi:hypothetical protein
MRDREPRLKNRTADDAPRDWTRTHRAKSRTVALKRARRDASIRKGRS